MWLDLPAALPALSLPEGYRLRGYRPGDAPAWELIIRETFATEPRFDPMMRRDPGFRPERVLFLFHGDEPAATASAYCRPQHGLGVGYLHMVGVRPRHNGKGLGYQISLACLLQMLHEGRRAALLQTDDYRIPAIKTYLKLG
ncbi:MAG: GNAT family N-acetyltransferase, partial [Rhodospirillales bacterium]|nr:GNAT family N-acetyltransferase [Rhodospirillales bacterium]